MMDNDRADVVAAFLGKAAVLNLEPRHTVQTMPGSAGGGSGTGVDGGWQVVV
jgi:hypothetical protein